MKENADIARWTKRYKRALCLFLEKRPGVSMLPALQLGRQAVDLALEPLDVARIHEQVLKSLILKKNTARGRQAVIGRAMKFFAETLVPIEQTHDAAKEDVLRVTRLGEELRARTAESSASTRRLARGVVRRRASESALKTSDERHAVLVKESRDLESRLQGQMRRIMAAQERERRKSSHNLQNEIAQVLVAIHVRLLTLKEAANANTENLKKEIAETQALVRQSVQTIKRLAYESGVHHET